MKFKFGFTPKKEKYEQLVEYFIMQHLCNFHKNEFINHARLLELENKLLIDFFLL